MATEGPGGIKTRTIATRYPTVKGLTAGTQKQTGRTTNLVYRKSLVPDKDKVGL